MLDLSDPEKELFMERASTAIEGGKLYFKILYLLIKYNYSLAILTLDLPYYSILQLKFFVWFYTLFTFDGIVDYHSNIYNNLYQRVTQIIDKGMNDDVAKKLMDDSPLENKADMIVEHAETGALALLKKYNDMKNKLTICLNQGLPAALRQYSWKLFLLHSKIRKQYVEQLNANPRGAISMYDFDISQVIENMFNTEETLYELKGHADKVSKQLQVKNPDASRVVIGTFSTDKDKTGTTETGDFNTLMDGMTAMLRPAIRSMFVTFLRTDTLLYVWDQYMIGIDTPGFSTEWMSIVCVTTIGLLKEKIRESGSVRQFSTYLEQKGFVFRTRESCRGALNPPWRHWVNDVVPPETKPKDRKLAREEREAEKEREEEDEFLKAAAEERDRERRKRLEIEKRTHDEIERLKRQMVVLQKAEIEADRKARDRKSPSIKSGRESVYSRLLIAPPPSAASMRPSPVMPPIQDLRTPTPRESPTAVRNKVLVDFLRRVAHGLEMISQGEGLEKEELDRDTDVYLQQNIADIKRAQKEVFGHMLQPGEFEDMDPAVQQKSSEKMLKLMQKWREERAKDELKKKIQK
ncbi:LOW QUALITY PROTEIN: hypothetical protein KUTeg_003327 [Tegillarca granosa]|uniref:Uncharacterized protein n=1 Tax=Tegillarca granosa TaxID=220873 RepID=A0ABQ9FQ14_TEGGR|nr:LOW QUALITY PROTEIN: hypothetical protein KUTeg_003327 [Tegillarca granosa]